MYENILDAFPRYQQILKNIAATYFTSFIA